MRATVVEHPEFTAAADGLFSDDEIRDLVLYLAQNPEAGDLIQGTGGVRKLRWAAKGKGKRGGARVIHFYKNTAGEVHLLTAYGKSTKANLTVEEKKTIRAIAKAI